MTPESLKSAFDQAEQDEREGRVRTKEEIEAISHKGEVKLSIVFNYEVLLRGARNGFLFALCLSALPFLPRLDVAHWTFFHAVAQIGALWLLFPAVAPFWPDTWNLNNYMYEAVALYFVFWMVVSTLLATILHRRTRLQKTIIWIVFCSLYLAYALFAIQRYGIRWFG